MSIPSIVHSTVRRHSKLSAGIPLKVFAGMVALCCLVSLPLRACTIFVLSDGNRSLFFNNEDWSNPKTRIWFVPAGNGYYGCAYVGFDDGTAQGGLNTEGLAYDVVAGYQGESRADLSLAPVRGNLYQRILETCATVDDAIAFCRKHQVAIAGYKALVADRTGASVTIGAKDGKLEIEKTTQCHGIGYGLQTLDKMLATSREATVDNGVNILRACAQQGKYATKYSNVFDLKSCDIVLLPFPARGDEIRLNLAAELKKGGHYYDMPQIVAQLPKTSQPLLINMKRLLLDELKPVPDNEPQATARARELIQGAANGTLRPEDFTAESWKEFAPGQKQVQAFLKTYGDFKSLITVDRRDEGGQRHYCYRVEFQKATVLFHFIFDEQYRQVFGEPEDEIWNSTTSAAVGPER